MRKQGAVSMYVVIFATMLLLVVTLSFVRVMLQEQRNTSGDDLSQAAYDSALAGVEDAKLAVMKYNDCLNRGDTTSASCKPAVDLIQGRAGAPAINSCDMVATILGGRQVGHETIIQESTSGSSATATELDQAYTCAKLSDAYGDFLGRLGGGTRSRLIPLRAKGTFDRIVINWGVRANGITGLPPERANTAMRELLPVDWPTNAPAVLTAHLIQTGPTYNLESFNESNGAQTNRGSLLLIPVRSGGSSMSVTSPLAASRLAEANNKSEPNLPIGVNCSVPSEINTADSGDAYLANYWACSATFGVPTVIGGGTRNSGTSFLRIEDVYGKTMTDFQVLLYNGSTFVGFAGVQTVVDVTGRAGDRFRRVEGRIEVVDSGFAYPEFTAELAGDGSEPNFCKDYIVTINPWVGDGMENDGNCP